MTQPMSLLYTIEAEGCVTGIPQLSPKTLGIGWPGSGRAKTKRPAQGRPFV